MSITMLKQFLQDNTALFKHSKKNSNYKYKSFYELVLELGQEMKPARTSKELTGQRKNCYGNCQALAFMEPELTYCEGFAIPNTIDFPASHAWLLDKSGTVIEVTWEEPGRAYLGIAFSTTFIKSILKEREENKGSNYLSLLECNHLEGYSFLKYGFPNDAYANGIMG
ncbi:hypothetical protein cce_5109 [Crocosphaera subtropica ATCC 51142]|uniref:Uncharacterized protein n=1 Tax=Crocosphaera subtropica (strain ATCC 51142 / BH68) TaxID=43989 RepID=B1X2U4_CROS5|nr:hypothetical protein [Crocosphaera subtropica]ACB54455.1 hypothetical protein cce_5109 [Crocosphaera subtropica ATCC 51142]